jgi:hypothetical protein
MPRAHADLRYAAAAMACACWLGGAAEAQQTPYQNHLIGERSLGLAGAYVGVADDPSAIFHNPGGIAVIDTSAASGSLWALARGARELEGGYRTSLGGADLRDTSPTSLPLFLSGVVKLGKKAEDGVRPHAIGAALLTPLQSGYRFVDQLEGDAAVDRLEVRHNDSARWIGASYGYRPRYGLSLGVSTFFADRSVSHDEVEIRAREDLPADSQVGSVLARASTVRIDAQHLVVRLGTLLQLTHELHAGLMFQLPGIELDASARAEHLDALTGPAPTAIASGSADGVGAAVPMPWELRLGLTVRRPPLSIVTLDVSLMGPDHSASAPLRLVQTDLPLGSFMPRTTYRRPSLRAALGFETVIGGVVPLRGGSFFERSSAPELPASTDTYSPDRIHYAGASLSFGIRTGHYDFSVGAIGVLGFGNGLALRRDPAPAAPERYETAGVSERTLLVFVGGARSAVGALVKTLLED